MTNELKDGTYLFLTLPGFLTDSIVKSIPAVSLCSYFVSLTVSCVAAWLAVNSVGVV